MTYIGPVAEYSLPLQVECKQIFRTPAVKASDVTAVVPVKDDLLGLVRTLQSLLRMVPGPSRIRIVDDGSRVPITLSALERAITRPLPNVSILRRDVNRGPASARNAATVGLSGWILFTDCACEHPVDLLDQLTQSREASKDHTVAIATPIAALGNGRLSRYMTQQGNLNPPMLDNAPQAVITASVLVYAPAGERIGWFDTGFREAGGEDIDFGLRLRHVGYIEWCPSAVVRHDFEECLDDFDKRFRRYGRGLRTLALKWGVSLEPFAFAACSADLQDLADRQFQRMLEGYRGL